MRHGNAGSSTRGLTTQDTYAKSFANNASQTAEIPAPTSAIDPTAKGPQILHDTLFTERDTATAVKAAWAV